MATKQRISYGITVEDAEHVFDTEYIDAIRAEVRKTLQAYAKRHYMHIDIRPFDGHCLAFELEIGPLIEDQSFGSGDLFAPSSRLMQHAMKFNEVGFGLCDFILRTEDRPVPGKVRVKQSVQVLYVSFTREIASKYWVS